MVGNIDIDIPATPTALLALKVLHTTSWQDRQLGVSLSWCSR